MNGEAEISGCDAILIPGGGFTGSGELYPSVLARLDRALAETGKPMLIPLSGATVHKPPPLDQAGFPITEAEAAADYLMQQGCDPARIVTEAYSRDTIGNAYFARVLHTGPAGYRRLLVVTSEFHMPRTEAVFRHVFSLPPADKPYELHFASTTDVGYSAAALQSRKQREANSLERWKGNMPKLDTLAALHRWLFTVHSAYAAGEKTQPATDAWSETY